MNEEQEKTERDFKRASSSDPVYKPRTHGLSTTWMCECGASVTIDCHLIGDGVASYSAWCNRCDQAMGKHGQPSQVPILELAAKYGFTGEDDGRATRKHTKKTG